MPFAIDIEPCDSEWTVDVAAPTRELGTHMEVKVASRSRLRGCQCSLVVNDSEMVFAVVAQYPVSLNGLRS